MNNLIKEINNKFKEKYNFLRLLEVIYDKSQFSCTIIFLFPQSIDEICEESRNEIYDFVSKYLNLNAKLIIKYKKSFLDEELIKDAVLKFFEKNNLSLYSNINKDNIQISKDIVFNIKLKMPNEFLSYIQQNNIQNKLKFYLEKEFIAEFYVDLVDNENQIDESILDERKDNISIPALQKVIRYEVYNAERFLGREISPYPELIKNQNKEKEQVILAGKINNIIKKEYKSKRNKNKDEVNYFYTFDLNDTTGTIPCIHFSSKSNEIKLDNLKNDLCYLFQGDIRDNSFGRRQFYIRYINACEFSLKSVEQATQQKQEEITIVDGYKNVFPQPYFTLTQDNLFDKVCYNELIMNNDIVVFDVETTGLDAESCEIIEIGACKIQKGVITQTFQTLVKPKRPIPDLITRITGIDNEMVKNSLNIGQVISDFIYFSKDCILSGYNVGFDMKFINNAGKEVNYNFTNIVEDTMAHAREKLLLKNFTLKSVAKNLEVSLNNAHRALNDAIATANVLLKLNIIEKK